MKRHYPQIKICGLTDPDEARACAEAGADAIGLVFYPPSTRNVTPERAAAITARLPAHVAAVGVFVDPGLDELVRVIARCSLQAVQLHGVESPDFVTDLKKRTGVRIIKTLFAARAPGLADAQRYDVAAYLVECGKGRLPGGNAMRWNWALAEPFGRQHPMVLAGGLAPATAALAISACLPDAVDASSGLEAAPGHKDLAKVNAFIETVHQTSALYDSQEKEIQTIF